MHSGKLHMLRDGVGDDLSVFSHGIHLHLFGVLEETAHHHRMLLGYIGGKCKEILELAAVGTYIHSGAGKHV